MFLTGGCVGVVGHKWKGHRCVCLCVSRALYMSEALGFRRRGRCSAPRAANSASEDEDNTRGRRGDKVGRNAMNAEEEGRANKGEKRRREEEER